MGLLTYGSSELNSLALIYELNTIIIISPIGLIIIYLKTIRNVNYSVIRK